MVEGTIGINSVFPLSFLQSQSQPICATLLFYRLNNMLYHTQAPNMVFYNLSQLTLKVRANCYASAKF